MLLVFINTIDSLYYMKFFLQIILALIVIVLLFFALGYMIKEQKNVNQIEVQAPIRFCWDVFQDDSKLPQWMSGVDKIEYVTGTVVEPGTQQKIIMKSVDKSSLSGVSELIRTITQIDPPTFFSYEYSNDMLNGYTDVRFEMKGDSITTITNQDVFAAKSLWMRSTLFLMKGSVEKRTQSHFDQLKSIIENEYALQVTQDSLTSPEEISISSELD